MPKDAVELLAETEILAGVPVDRLRHLDPPPARLTIKAGETLIEQGQEGEAFYLLVHGRLRVFVSGIDGANRQVGEVLPGEGVGEMSLLTGETTSATVRAMHDCELVRFTRESYKQLMETSPEAALQVTRTVIKRLRSGLTGNGGKLFYSAVAVVPVSPGVEIGPFVDMLRTQLSEFAATAAIGLDDLETRYTNLIRRSSGIATEDRSDVLTKLMAIQDENDITLYIADAMPTEWTKLCLNQADLILSVGAVEDAPDLSEVESSLISRSDPDLAPRNELVLLHPGEWRAHCGTGRWLAARKLSDFHHARPQVIGDFARLARILTGNAINLVLGGGGARGFAQIGVLKALDDAGIPVDRVAGTSMGSLVGALYALGKPLDEITRINREIWIEGKPLSDYTFPAIAIVRGRRLHNLVKHALQGWEIEDMPIRFFCVSGDLTATDLMMHDSGTLWEGVRASGSIPGAGPPMFLNGHVLVDGGVLNNLPGDIMMERYSGAVVAIDVNPMESMGVPADIDVVPSGWGVLWNRINPFANPLKVPGIFEILYRTATLSSGRLAKRTHGRTDFLLTPPVSNFRVLEFDALEEIAEIGYRDTIAALKGELAPRIARYAHPERLPDLPPIRRPDPRKGARVENAETARRSALRRLAAAAALLLAVAGGAWGYMNGGGAPDETAAVEMMSVEAPKAEKHDGANILPVGVVIARHSDGYKVSNRYAGRIVSRRETGLGFERTGTVVEMTVDEGDKVTKGQVLARLDTRTLEAHRRELQADLAVSKASRAETQSRLDLALTTMKRRAELLKRNNVSQQAYDEARFEVDGLRSALAANAAEIARADALLNSLEVDIEKSAIRASFDGTIIDRKVDEGAAVTGGAVVVQLSEDAVKEVRVGLPVQVARHLTPGETYEIEVDGQTHPARLKALLTSLNPQTRTLPAILEVEDAGRRLRSGELAELKVAYRIKAEGFWLPITAIVGGRRGLWNAYALTDSDVPGLAKATRRELQMLYSDSTRAYVRGTLRDGERVVSGGLHRLVPGQLVKPAPARE
jgi:RND family efflux transporter MFP subunit